LPRGAANLPRIDIPFLVMQGSEYHIMPPRRPVTGCLP
jgi:hypothetical protein